jgi:predicted RNA binding protein YcfA (HicA-like mRNA interferase family)
MGTIQNISLEDLKSFLKANGLKQIRTKGGHLVWSRSDLRRPVIIQSHISPVPEFIFSVLQDIFYTSCLVIIYGVISQPALAA